MLEYVKPIIFPTMNTKVENKVAVLSDTLKELFWNKMNLARIKFFGLFISESNLFALKNWPVVLIPMLKLNRHFAGYRDLYQNILWT